MQLGTPPDDDDAFKQTPDLDSCKALQRDWIGKPCKIFRSKRERQKEQGTTMMQGGQSLQGWDHHMKKTDVGEIQHKICENKWG